jgi:hypothetical protein
MSGSADAAEAIRALLPSEGSIFQSRNEPEIEIYFQCGMSLKTAFVSNTG